MLAKEVRILALRPPIKCRTSDHVMINFPFPQESRHSNNIISMKNGNSGKINLVGRRRVHLRVSAHV